MTDQGNQQRDVQHFEKQGSGFHGGRGCCGVPYGGYQGCWGGCTRFSCYSSCGWQLDPCGCNSWCNTCGCNPCNCGFQCGFPNWNFGCGCGGRGCQSCYGSSHSCRRKNKHCTVKVVSGTNF